MGYAVEDAEGEEGPAGDLRGGLEVGGRWRYGDWREGGNRERGLGIKELGRKRREQVLR